MADTFQDICWGIVKGFQDAILGTTKIFKLDSDKSQEVEQKEKHLTTLAKRRADKKSATKTVEKKDRFVKKC